MSGIWVIGFLVAAGLREVVVVPFLGLRWRGLEGSSWRGLELGFFNGSGDASAVAGAQ